MPKDDYFRIVFEILKDLYVAKKKAEPVSLIKISAENLKIPQGYRDTILSEMLESGYVSERKRLDYKDPIKSFEELIKEKMDDLGLDRLAATEYILNSATRTRKSVNRKLGLEK